MEFRDWFGRGGRRQAAAAPAPRPAEDGAGDGTRSADAPETARPAARPDADWDGGWRRVAPPAVTVARSSIGVSDGLRFRSRLASWQNIAYGGELGHAVLPSAPVGLIHGVARPGAARTSAPGAPLLLRAAGAPEEAVRPPVSEASVPETPGRASTGRGPTTRRPGPDDTATRSGADSAVAPTAAPAPAPRARPAAVRPGAPRRPWSSPAARQRPCGASPRSRQLRL